jgi:hypothetical protein
MSAKDQARIATAVDADALCLSTRQSGVLRYLSRLRPSDRESVPLILLATDYSLLATYYSCFWEGRTLGPIRMRAVAFLVGGSEDIWSRFW